MLNNVDLDIWRSCKKGDLDMVRILLREGQDINESTTSYRNTPLHIAAKFGRVLIVKYLLEQGAMIHLGNASGLNALDVTIQAIEMITGQVMAIQ